MIDDILYPLTLPQEAFYYDYLLHRNDNKYIMGGILILNGPLDIELYQDAYNYVIKHFDIMRVLYVKKGDELFQHFRPEYNCNIKFFDYRHFPSPKEKAFEFILSEYQKPVAFESQDLYSEMIIQTEDEQFIFAPKFHHMTNDGAGRAVINQLVADTYNSLLDTGECPALSGFSYKDFLDDDLKYRESDSYRSSFEFWKNKFSELPEPLSFTMKKKSTKNLSLHTERLTLNMHRICFDTIQNIASEADVTTFQVILALLSVCLHKCYERDEFIIGMPVLNRSNHKFRNTPGLFMNMIGVNIRVDPGHKFTDLLNLIKSEIRECYRHQRFPLRQITRHLRNAYPDFGNELFDVTVVYRKVDYNQKIGGSKLNSITFDTSLRSESLSIEIDEYDEEENVNIFFNYNPQVISSDELMQFISTFETILLELVHFPEMPVSSLKILNDFESHRILNEFNDSGCPVNADKTIIRLFEETASKKGEAAAVIHNDEIVSYRELNERADSIAGYLLDRCNIQPEEIICLASERSVNTVAAFLGILKAGAACLPLDNEYPAERLKYIFEDSGARIYITGKDDAGKAADFTGKILLLEELAGITGTHVEKPEIRGDNLAYVIYTSGSTGKPKGVQIEHFQFMSMFQNVIGGYGVMETDRVLQFASHGFDASVFEIFQALLTGAVLVIADRKIIRNTELFIRYLDEKEVTFATLPPAYLHALNKAEMPFMKTIVTAGEPAIAHDINFYKMFKRVINGYGPTETSVCAAFYTAKKTEDYANAVPIGKPYPGCRIYILNKSLEPVPIGFAGELCVSGPALARGYLKNEELTREKFVDNPFEEGARLYRTGDLARWREDGNLEFLGRIDEQVKIKGNRIELREIEARLAEFGNITEAAVLDIQRGEERELAAFISTITPAGTAEIKAHLRKFLPEYMIPQHFVFVEKLPLTFNGKINKEALRKLPLNISSKKNEPAAASNPLERRLAEMFEDILDIKPIGIDDNFFELGGESLKVARLVSRIYKELEREISFKVIFDSPTVRGIAAELESSAADTVYKEIMPAAEKEFYALSHSQQRIWILSQNRENSAAYHMPVPLLLEGELNINALEKALRKIIERHESLRTVFREINGVPYQKILNEIDFKAGIYDLCDNGRREESASAVIKERMMAPFYLERDLPVRADIIKLENERSILLLVIHHIAADGISVGIILKELATLYNSQAAGDTAELPPLRIQYKDYCAYEEELINSRKLSEEKEYWIKKLQAPLPVLELPYDFPRPPVKTYSGSYINFEIEDQLSEKLQAFCREHGVSLYSAMLSVVNILLCKYSAQEEIIIGSPSAGRNHPDLEEQVGVYINTIALRNKINSHESFLDFLSEVQNNSASAIANSNYPFDRLIQLLNLDRDTSRTPVFDVLLQLQTDGISDIGLTGIRSSIYDAEFVLNKFDLTFTFIQENSSLKFSIGYNTGLFTREHIIRTAGHLINIVKYVTENPEHKLKSIDMLSGDERKAINLMATGTAREYDKKLSIAELFEVQVKKTPDNTALVYNTAKYSYRELNERADRVALEIRMKFDIGQDEIIGIMTSRSELMIIGLLGILKAGAAYMPVDPGYPAERISYMLNDCGAKILLTESSLLQAAENAAAGNLQHMKNKIEILNIENIENGASGLSVRGAAASELVYVLYTSGSTGKPKGVMIRQSSLHNLVLGLAESVYQNQTKPLNIALMAPFVFDASVKQIFYALLYGHCLDILPDDVKMSGRRLLQYYKEHSIDVSDGTPAHLEIITDELKGLKDIYLPGRFVIGGQQLMFQTVRRLYDLADGKFPAVSNVYGPTECCDVSSCYNISADMFTAEESSPAAFPIGKPLNNIQVYILDSDMEIVPVGVRGELFIGGDGLALGYVNKPGLTSQRFIEIKGVKLYRTGDIGCYLPDGNILLSGRMDDQIKLRGYRIELGEIESCIWNYGKISQTAVVPVGETGNQEIAAYYCSSEKIDIENLKQFLAAYLPAYMIPSYFIEMDRLPLSRNGKIDKKLLPPPVRSANETVQSAEPADQLEARLCNIWEELLNVKKIAPSDNFFQSGGHSLIAIRLASRIHKEFNVELNIWEIFQNPEVTKLASFLRSKNPSSFAVIEPVEIKDYYSLSNSQRRLWFLSKLEGQNSLYNMPGALIMNGPLDAGILEEVLKMSIQRHESFRTCFIEINGEPFQRILPEVEFSIEKITYPGETWTEEDLLRLADEYFDFEFDLSIAPLFKARLITLSSGKFLLLINMHHIISDGWSLDVFIREIEILYSSIQKGENASLHPLRIQYKDFTAWQNNLLAGPAMEKMHDYWKQKLAGPRSQLNLPSDYKRDASFSFEGELLHFTLERNMVDALKSTGSVQDASLFMVLLAALYTLLYKYTGEEDIIIGSPVAGRQHSDLDDQIGYYISTIVLRQSVNPDDTFEKLLSLIRETMTGALDNQAYPFDMLVDEFEKERNINRNPLFDIMAAWMVKASMNMKTKFGEVDVSGINIRIGKSMFDLSFLFNETDGNLTYAIEYNKSLFSRERITRMAAHYKVLLNSIAAFPAVKIKDLEIIPPAEKEILLQIEKNKCQSPVNGKNVMDMFKSRCRLNGNTPALVSGDRKITYSELQKISNSIANLITSAAAPGKDDVIAVLIDDPLLASAAIPAVMKTGAAYLPVITDNPADRIEFILRDSRAICILTDNDAIVSLTDSKGSKIKNRPVIDLRLTHGTDETEPAAKISMDSLAYIIYTSGTTGKPKGVMVEHQSLSNLIMSLQDDIYSHLEEGQNELMITSFAFDVSVKQLFAALCTGNTLHLLEKEKRMDPREIVKYISGNNISIIDITPSVFAVMLEEGFSGIKKESLKKIFLGSEALPFKLVKAFYAEPENIRIDITNFYGPTEACVEISRFDIKPDMTDRHYDITPIGYPLINNRLYILDKYLNLCPIGIPGEICISGVNLARGYLNDPERTAEKFICPEWLGGARIYRTGDRGRMSEDGSIEIMGRIDEQVKIRGYRVELQEIELCLNSYEEIRECAAVISGHEGTSELIAYYTAVSAIETVKLRNHLASFLPGYMIPSRFIRIEKMPLSHNGKIDKKMLPHPEPVSRNNQAEEPMDDIETLILQICCSILNKDDISIDDNFFEAGGNSLNAVRLVSRIQKELNIELALKEIFYNPVIRAVAGKARESIAIYRPEEQNVSEIYIAPASEEELNLLSNLQFDDEE